MTFHCDREEFGMAPISERESTEIEAANASDTTPVVFIHGLWVLSSSWANWADFFKQAGYAPLTPDWPDDPETVEEARAAPEVLAKKTLRYVADHTTEIIGALDTDEGEAKRLYDTYHVAGSGIALAQMGNANLNPWTESKV